MAIFNQQSWTKVLLCALFLLTGFQALAQQLPGDTLSLSYIGVGYKMYVPKGIAHLSNKIRFLVMIHGTSGKAVDYLGIPLTHHDAEINKLIVIAPQFPEGTKNPWSRYENWHVRWLWLL